jgi:hypothetical protein
VDVSQTPNDPLDTLATDDELAGWRVHGDSLSARIAGLTPPVLPTGSGTCPTSRGLQCRRDYLGRFISPTRARAQWSRQMGPQALARGKSVGVSTFVETLPRVTRTPVPMLPVNRAEFGLKIFFRFTRSAAAEVSAVVIGS